VRRAESDVAREATVRRVAESVRRALRIVGPPEDSLTERVQAPETIEAVDLLPAP
jgi:hypothetical protein